MEFRSNPDPVSAFNVKILIPNIRESITPVTGRDGQYRSASTLVLKYVLRTCDIHSSAYICRLLLLSLNSFRPLILTSGVSNSDRLRAGPVYNDPKCYLKMHALAFHLDPLISSVYPQ